MKRVNGKIARADSCALEIADLRREHRLLRKTVKSWRQRRRKLLLKERIYGAVHGVHEARDD